MNPIVTGIGKKALDLFYKKFGKRIANTVAESKWLANTLRLLKQKAHKPKTSDVAQRVREKMLKDKPFEGFTPKIVKTKKVPPSVKGKVVDPFKKKVAPSNVVDLKWWKKMRDQGDFQKGGSVDKALPKRSRDI